MPLYRRLPPEMQDEVRGRMAVFLAEKEFEGCNGLVVTDEMKIMVAAMGCMLLLKQDFEYYPLLNSILLYPAPYMAKPDEIVVGMQVSGNHMSSAHEGDTVRAVGTIIHKGRSSHVWNVDVFTSTDKLVSSIRVINSILKKR